jgi:hypothetical protein
MLKKDSLLTIQAAPNMNQLLMQAYKIVNPVEERTGRQCRFMLFVRLRPGIVSHFRNQQRTGYYPGDKYTDKPHEMLRNLLKMIDKGLPKYDRIELYDNDRGGEERIILKITDDCINRNELRQYHLMLTNYILPKWLQQ